MKNKPVPTLTDEAVKKLALDCIKGLVFTDRHLLQAGRENLLSQIFLPYGVGALDDYLENIAMIYEYLDQCEAGHTINGFPIFVSCRMLSKQQITTFNDYVAKYYDALGSV